MSDNIPITDALRSAARRYVDTRRITSAVLKITEMHRPVPDVDGDRCEWCSELSRETIAWPCEHYLIIESALTGLETDQ